MPDSEYEIRSNVARNQSERIATPTFFSKAVDAHIEGMRHSFSYFPDREYQIFCEWILSTDTIRDRWLQLTAVTQQIKLTEKLLQGILNEEELNYSLPYCVALNTYLTYEVVSDNLAIGLALRQADDTTYDARRELLRVFNSALSQQIRGTSSINATSALESLRSLIRNISAYDQSLNPLQHERIAAAFLAENGNFVRAENLEYGLYSTLVANIESCLNFKDVMSSFDLYPFLREKLAERYDGVNQLLGNSSLTIKNLVDIGTNTILIIPVIGFYSAIVGEILRPSAGYQTILEDGSLMDMLQDAALLIRLLNDMGTHVLEQTPQERMEMIDHMHKQQNEFGSFDELLLNMTKTSGSNLTRIKKDLQFGEFNIGLYAPLKADNIEEAVSIFEQNLEYLSNLYQERKQNLNQTAKRISLTLGGATLVQVITRSVWFHHAVYSQSFDDHSGEYAI